MITNIYTVFDDAAKVYGSPFFSLNESVAIRSFTDATNDKNTMLNRHPEQFTLFQIGTYDDQTGTIEPMVPQYIIKASMVEIEQEPEEFCTREDIQKIIDNMKEELSLKVGGTI